MVTPRSTSKPRALEAATERLSHHIERLLHRLFAEFRLKPSGSTAARYPRLRRGEDGSTEWFDMVCWDRLTRFLADNRDLLKFGDVASDALHAIGDAINADCAKVARARQTAAYRTAELHYQAAESRNVEREQVAEEIAQSFQKLRCGCSFLSVVAADGRMVLVGTGPRNRARLTVTQLNILVRSLAALAPNTSIHRENHCATDAKGAVHFAVALPGEPGLGPARQVQQLNWSDELNSLLWGCKPDIPGFDLPLSLDEMQTASLVYGKAHVNRKVLGIPLSASTDAI